MTIDDKLKVDKRKAELKEVMGKCFVNGIYHYRSPEPKEKKTFCLIGDDTCSYYRKHKSQDYCNKVPRQ